MSGCSGVVDTMDVHHRQRLDNPCHYTTQTANELSGCNDVADRIKAADMCVPVRFLAHWVRSVLVLYTKSENARESI